jgi:hypothetical protein
MKKATRVLVNWINEKSVKAVDVKLLKFDDAKPNECYQNMNLFLDNYENWSMHSGWLVGDFLGERGTAIIPHYWVVNADREHLDVTPKNPSDKQSYEYVSDFNIVQYFTKEVQLPVPLKLNLNGTFVARRKDGSFELIEKIDYEHLFSLSRQ